MAQILQSTKCAQPYAESFGNLFEIVIIVDAHVARILDQQFDRLWY